MDNKTRPKTARGRKPVFFQDPGIDKLVAITMALAAEVSTLRDRVDTHERLADAGIKPTSDAVESEEVSDEVAVQRQEKRDAFVDRVFRAVTDELERLEKGNSKDSYNEIIDQLAN